MSDLEAGPDGSLRCGWATSAPEYLGYHDLEWGRPVADETAVFEKLCLEGFQSGLSWLTILRKRDAFRHAFASFDPETVARFGEADVDRLLGDPGIVRHRGKITATIANARATLELREHGRTLAALLWSYEPAAREAPRSFFDLAASTPESKALSRELRGLGFSFVGPTTVYSTMQALGVVNDHLAACVVRHEVELLREGFSRPDRPA